MSSAHRHDGSGRRRQEKRRPPKVLVGTGDEARPRDGGCGGLRGLCDSEDELGSEGESEGEARRPALPSALSHRETIAGAAPLSPIGEKLYRPASPRLILTFPRREGRSTLAADLAPPLRRALARLASTARELPAEELARELFAMSATPPLPLAKQLLATAFGCAAEHLPARIAPSRLASTRAGPVAQLSLAHADFAVVDLETTGVAPGRASILEIGAVRVRAGRCGESFETLVDPREEIPRSITALTGIGREEIREAPDLDTALRDFDAWLGARPAPVLVAHNAAFDAGFLARAYTGRGRPFWGQTVLCTRRLGRRLLPGLGRYHLDSLCAHFGVRNGARHRALGDARATARVWVELLAIANHTGLKTLGDLLDLQSQVPASSRPKRRRATGASRRT